MKRPNIRERAKAYLNRWEIYSNLIGVTPREVRSAWNEFDRNSDIFYELHTALRAVVGVRESKLGANLKGSSLMERIITGFGPSIPNHELYVLVRLARPNRIIETGVAAGISTTIILSALERNSRGHLWSIDLPNYGPEGYLNADGIRELVQVPPGKKPGWIVPDHLRHRWDLLVGRSSDVLPTIVKKIGSLDFFYHDSEHSEANMIFEYRTAWQNLELGGILYSDDVIWNRAFEDFSTSVGVQPSLTPSGRGAIKRGTGNPTG